MKANEGPNLPTTPIHSLKHPTKRISFHKPKREKKKKNNPSPQKCIEEDLFDYSTSDNVTRKINLHGHLVVSFNHTNHFNGIKTRFIV